MIFFFVFKSKIEKGRRKVIHIKEGEIFCLPPCIPHSPQRKIIDSLGLVIERKRETWEMDAIRFYKDFSKCQDKLWERYFYCLDLSKDLLPIITEWNESSEKKTRETIQDISLPKTRLISENSRIKLPAPIHLQNFLDNNKDELAKDGSCIPLFKSHPDKQFKINIYGRHSQQKSIPVSYESLETLIFQLKGTSTLLLYSENITSFENENSNHSTAYLINAQSVFLVPCQQKFRFEQNSESICMVIQQLSISHESDP